MNDESYGLMFILPSGEIQTFNALPVSIGRAAENDIVIDHEAVSAMHAQVYYDDHLGDVCIQDLDSLNGVAINDLPTRKNVLHDGVKISLGGVQLTFRDTGYIHAG
jgi:pSer/pThr/pTyr-binding forkhead associated (FHA) protein